MTSYFSGDVIINNIFIIISSVIITRKISKECYGINSVTLFILQNLIVKILYIKSNTMQYATHKKFQEFFKNS